MNQEKVGKFISKIRKEKKMTQQELASKIGVTDRAISNWENGRRLPDYSIIKDLCKELGITINELLSGEKLSKEEYQKKFEENIINITIDNKKIINKKEKVIWVSLFLLLTFIISLFYIYNYYEIDVRYEERTMKCEFEDNTLIYYINGSSVLNTDYIERIIDNQKYMVFHSTINIYNKRHSNWEYGESFARVVNNEEIPFGTRWTFDKEKDDNLKVTIYYTNKALNKIKNLSDQEFLKELNKSFKMCSNIEDK